MASSLSKNANTQNGVSGNGKTISAGGDSGNITTIPQPGQSSAPKLTDMTQQSATTRSSDQTVSGVGNCINGSGVGSGNQVATYGPAGNSLGYSLID
jgi:hypothetical protein